MTAPPITAGAIVGRLRMAAQHAITSLRADDRATLAGFAVLFGLLAAVLGGYRYGLSDHAEQLPLIFRAMDSGYLANDFFVNAASEFGPRFYYVHFMAFVGSYVPLPAAFFVIWAITYLGLSLVTAFAARDITGSVFAGMLAVVFVTVLTPFRWGSPDVPDNFLRPAFLVLPFALFALWKGIKGEPLKAAAASVPAILIHPVVGVEVAALALAGAAVNRYVSARAARRAQLFGWGG